MTARVKTQFIQNKEILEMFKDIIGTGSNPTSDISVPYDKYHVLVDQVLKFIKVNEILAKSTASHEAYYKNLLDASKKFVKIPRPTTETDCKEFNRYYQNIIQDEIINQILFVGKLITPYGSFIQNNNSTFLFDQPGIAITFHTVDFKSMAKSNCNMTMSFLKKFLEIVKEIHELLITPDISVKNFTKIAMAAINELESHIPRCKEAFDKIRNSVTLLETS